MGAGVRSAQRKGRGWAFLLARRIRRHRLCGSPTASTGSAFFRRSRISVIGCLARHALEIVAVDSGFGLTPLPTPHAL